MKWSGRSGRCLTGEFRLILLQNELLFVLDVATW